MNAYTDGDSNFYSDHNISVLFQLVTRQCAMLPKRDICIFFDFQAMVVPNPLDHDGNNEGYLPSLTPRTRAYRKGVVDSPASL